jgi:HlyD family secretion protein
MKTNNNQFIIPKVATAILITTIFYSCNNNKEKSDAFGNFESKEIIISSELPGKVIFENLIEGQTIDSGVLVCLTDTTSLYLQKELIKSQKNAAASRFSDIVAQVNVLKEQKRVAEIEKKRIIKLLKDSAATTKQRDEIDGKISVLDKQILQVENQNKNLFDQLKTFDSQINIVDENIHKSHIVNPVKGTVLAKYIEKYEMLTPGKPIYKVANTQNLILRAYISGKQLSDVKLNQKVTVRYDGNSAEMKEIAGIVIRISDKSEFTPKTIQTKEERINYVYFVEVLVDNNGELKIGMPGEVKF